MRTNEAAKAAKSAMIAATFTAEELIAALHYWEAPGRATGAAQKRWLAALQVESAKRVAT